MYPTLIAGLLLIATAARYARHPERQRLGLIVWLSVLTMFVGTLGFVTGMIKASITVGQTEAPIHMLIQGFGEALNNVALGLCSVVLGGVLGAIGLYRRKRATSAATGGGSLVDPFA